MGHHEMFIPRRSQSQTKCPSLRHAPSREGLSRELTIAASLSAAHRIVPYVVRIADDVIGPVSVQGIPEAALTPPPRASRTTVSEASYRAREWTGMVVQARSATLRRILSTTQAVNTILADKVKSGLQARSPQVTPGPESWQTCPTAYLLRSTSRRRIRHQRTRFLPHQGRGRTLLGTLSQRRRTRTSHMSPLAAPDSAPKKGRKQEQSMHRMDNRFRGMEG